MKERPILFSGEMVRAILDGRKTQTRRVVKPQPAPQPARIAYWGKEIPKGLDIWVPESNSGKVGVFIPGQYTCPYGAPGQRLWVREMMREEKASWVYEADKAPVMVAKSDELAMRTWAHHKEQDYCTSMFMPKWACRIWLEITEVRVQRVQDMSIDDGWNEGVSMPYERGDGPWDDPGAKERFPALWDSINAKRGYSWESNPFVWVVSFKRIP